ncbi:MAG: ParB N-terminal domain-containing protein [Bacteroidales bacterium]|nr:ParB N-terminal domain-containing protein [Bacteroidales bacterium]
MKKSNFDSERLQSAEKLKADDSFTPCPINKGDELFPNGIFVFNITKMLESLKINSNEVDLVEVEVHDFPKSFSSIDESHVDSVDISQPVILAEITPGHYSLIDGNHRMEKARRMGEKSILAYNLNVKQHLPFLTEKKAYLSYIEYWNGKCG